jgi:hypothetical protein
MRGRAGPKWSGVKRLPLIQPQTSRRAFLTSTAVGALAIVPLAALACSKKLVCTDVSKLKADEQQARSAVGYKEPTPEPASAATTARPTRRRGRPVRRVLGREGPDPPRGLLQHLAPEGLSPGGWPGRPRPSATPRDQLLPVRGHDGVLDRIMAEEIGGAQHGGGGLREPAGQRTGGRSGGDLGRGGLPRRGSTRSCHAHVQVAALGIGDRSHRPFVEHEHVGTSEAGEEPNVRAVSAHRSRTRTTKQRRPPHAQRDLESGVRDGLVPRYVLSFERIERNGEREGMLADASRELLVCERAPVALRPVDEVHCAKLNRHRLG